MGSEEKKSLKSKMARDSGKISKAAFKKYVIDCSTPVGDKIMDISAFETFLTERIKVKGQTGNFNDDVEVIREKSKIIISTQVHSKKSYFKYLTKKFLKKHGVRDWLRVISSNKENMVYELKYFNIADNEDEDED